MPVCGHERVPSCQNSIDVYDDEHQRILPAVVARDLSGSHAEKHRRTRGEVEGYVVSEDPATVGNGDSASPQLEVWVGRLANENVVHLHSGIAQE